MKHAITPSQASLDVRTFRRMTRNRRMVDPVNLVGAFCVVVFLGSLAAQWRAV